MIGSFLTRGLVMALGYAYPAYECFKAVEMNKPEIEQLRFWCQYWILVAALTVFERVGDVFISWLPMYSEAKLAFFVYLWFPKTRGTTYVYESFLRPYVAKHEPEIDRNLMELRTRVGDMIVIYWQKAATYGQTRIYEVLQYLASQSPSAHQPPPQQQQQQQEAGVRRPPPPAPSARLPPDPSTRSPAELSTHPPATSQESQHSTLRTPSTSAATAKQQEPSDNADPPSSKQPAAFHQARPPAQSQPESSNQQPATLETDTTQSSGTLTVANGNGNPSPPEIVMEEATHVTRGRLRKTQAPTNP